MILWHFTQLQIISRALGRTLIGGGGCILIYLGSARLISFEINFISKETSWAEPEYVNIHPYPPPPPMNALATALIISKSKPALILSCR